MASSLITSGELAKRIGIKPSTVRGYIRSGRLKPTQRTPGGQARFDPLDARRQLGLPVPPEMQPAEYAGSIALVDELPAEFAGALSGSTQTLAQLAPGTRAPSREDFIAGFGGGAREDLPGYGAQDVRSLPLGRATLEG
jgi:hypothetical protein